MKPLIGITSGTIYNHEFPYYPYTLGQMHTYTESVVLAGGTPVIIPIGKPSDAQGILQRLDGVLFAGGNDVSPKLYKEKPRYIEERGVDKSRDDYEVALMNQALSQGMPILAICRGMQLLNVVYGGTLYQDIEKQQPGKAEHEGRRIKEDFQHLAHNLSLDPQSRLSYILGATKIWANTHHHQALKDLGQGLAISARAEDGIVEGVEDVEKTFVIGVQPHPEALVAHDSKSPWKPLFDSFVNACKQK